MPTGYTAGIEDGRIKTLKQYATKVACAFFYDMDQLPEKFVADTAWDDEEIAEAEKTLDRCRNMSISDCQQAAEKDHKKKYKEYLQSCLDARDTSEKYENMNSKVVNWKVPVELEALRKFMLQQIEESTKYEYHPTLPTKLSGMEWLEETMRRTKNDIKIHTENREKAIKRAAEGNKFLKALKEALKNAG